MAIQTKQFDGWFGTLGQTGALLDNVLTIILALIMVGLGGFFAWKAIKVGMTISNAASAEERAEAKKSLMSLIIGIICSVVGPTILLTLLWTVGKTVELKGDSSGGSKTDLLLDLSLQNIKLPLKLNNLITFKL